VRGYRFALVRPYVPLFRRFPLIAIVTTGHSKIKVTNQKSAMVLDSLNY